MSYKPLIFAVFMPKKEKIANTYVSAILNSNGAPNRSRTRSLQIRSLTLYPVALSGHFINHKHFLFLIKKLFMI